MLGIGLGIAKNNNQSAEFDINPLMDLINLQSNDASKFTIISPNKISVWTDTNNATTWNQTTDANRPLLNNGVVFDGSNDTLVKASNITATDYSFYCVLRDLSINTGVSGNKALFSGVTENSWLGFSNGYGFALNVSAVQQRTVVAGYKGNRYVIFGIRKSGNTFTFTINDRVCLQTGTNAVTNTLFGRLGSISGFSGFNPNMNIKAFCLSSTVFSNTVHKKIVDRLYDIYNVGDITTADNICGFGDSNTAGQGTTSYLVGLSTQMNLAHLNLGISGTRFVNTGATVNNGYDRYQSQIVTKPYTDYVVVQYGTNDISSGLTTTIFQYQMNEMISSLIEQGYNPNRICLCSNPYQRDNANATALNDYRTVIQNIATANGTKYFDLLQATRDGGGNSLLSDTVHLNASGMTIWQNGVYNALTT